MNITMSTSLVTTEATTTPHLAFGNATLPAPSMATYQSSYVVPASSASPVFSSSPGPAHSSIHAPLPFNATNNTSISSASASGWLPSSSANATKENKGSIAGGIVGVLVTLAICGGAYWLWRRRRRATRTQEPDAWANKPYAGQDSEPRSHFDIAPTPSPITAPNPTTSSSSTHTPRDIAHAQDAGPLLLPPAYDPAWREPAPRLPTLNIPTSGSASAAGSASASSNPFEGTSWDDRQLTPEVVRDTKRLLGVDEKETMPMSPFADVHEPSRPDSKV